MGRIFRLILGCVLLASCFVGCNSYKAKIQNVDKGPLNVASINYQFVNAQVFEPHCVLCHGLAGGNKGDINLETYENVLANLTGIEEAVFIEESMPPKKAGGPLPAYEKSILRMWIDAGAPKEVAEVPQNPEPGPTPEPTPEVSPTPIAEPEIVAATWMDIYTKILEPKCISCHAVGEKAEDYPLKDKTYVADPDNLMVIPGDPENSEIYLSITRQDKRKMPPPKTNVTLSTQEIDAIKNWILSGAKD